MNTCKKHLPGSLDQRHQGLEDRPFLNFTSTMANSDIRNLTASPRDESRVSLILAVQTPLLILALIFFALRIHSRCRPVLNLWWDDYFITIAMVSLAKERITGSEG